MFVNEWREVSMELGKWPSYVNKHFLCERFCVTLNEAPKGGYGGQGDVFLELI